MGKHRPKPYRQDDASHEVASTQNGTDRSPAAHDPYIEEATANPERYDNGCMVYRRSA